MRESVRHPYVPASMVVVLTWLLCTMACGCNAIADGFGIEPVADSTGPIVSLLERMDARADANYKATIEALSALKPTDGYKRGESAWPDAEPQKPAAADPVQLVAKLSQDIDAMRREAAAARFTGARVFVRDVAKTIDGTSDCVPCVWLYRAIGTAPGWTIGDDESNHFVLVASSTIPTPTVVYYRDGKEISRYEGFGVAAWRNGDASERNHILRLHPKRESPVKFSSPYKSREPVQVQGAMRTDWPDADPNPQPIADGGGCAGPQFAVGCDGGYQMRTPAVSVRTWFAAPVRRMVCDPVTGVCW